MLFLDLSSVLIVWGEKLSIKKDPNNIKESPLKGLLREWP